MFRSENTLNTALTIREISYSDETILIVTKELVELIRPRKSQFGNKNIIKLHLIVIFVPMLQMFQWMLKLKGMFPIITCNMFFNGIKKLVPQFGGK